jgi:hypothetical protein
MTRLRFWLTVLAVYVTYFALSFPIHHWWLDPLYKAHASVWRPQTELEAKQWIMFVTGAFFATMFVYIFTRGYQRRGLGEGLRFGLVVALFVSLPVAYENYVILPIPYELAIKWFASGLVVCLAMGAVAALVWKPAD